MNDILNELRDGIGLDPLPSPSAGAEAEDQLFSERAFWLYATGHRLGDMRRLVRQYRRDRSSLSGGRLPPGRSFGDVVAFPVPVNENNNPDFDRAACDPEPRA